MLIARILFPLLSLCLLSTVSHAVVMQDDLSITVSTNTPVVALGQDVIVDMNITNNSANDITFGFISDIALTFWNIQSSDINGEDCFVNGMCDDLGSDFNAFMDFHWGPTPQTISAGTTQTINFWNLRFTDLVQPGVLEIGQTELTFGNFFGGNSLNYLTNGLTIQIGPSAAVSAPSALALFGAFGLFLSVFRRKLTR